MSCGKCQCGKACIINHELIADLCYCGGIHKMCNNICASCKQNKCCYINNHKTVYGPCLCLKCNKDEYCSG